MTRTYHGSCHCGAVRFEADIDFSKGTTRCNCSICTKARAWFTIVPASQFRLVTGEKSLIDYQWTPPTREQPNLHYNFCKTCGVRAFAQGDQQSLGGKFYAVAIAALDDVAPEELIGRIKCVDGRHDQYDKAPDDTRLM